jgi:hypothetical protein
LSLCAWKYLPDPEAYCASTERSASGAPENARVDVVMPMRLDTQYISDVFATY